jgi:hypothetical protein
MSNETIEKLYSRLNGNEDRPTPNQIQRYLENEEKITDLTRDAGYDIPAGVIQGFMENGVLDEERFNKFKSGIRRFVENRGIEALGSLTTDFIREDGSISENKFRRKTRAK